MSAIEKRKIKLKERIQVLERDINTALKKKAHDGTEINIPKKTAELQKLKQDLAKLK